MATFNITYATPEGPITVVYDTDLAHSWVVPVGSIRVTEITDGVGQFRPKNTAVFNPNFTAAGGGFSGHDGGRS